LLPKQNSIDWIFRVLGDKISVKLLTHIGSVEKVKMARHSELALVIGAKKAEAVAEYFLKNESDQ